MTSIIQYGMVGGGEDSFIGNIHRIAASLDNHFQLVTGVFSSDPERSVHFGNRLNLSNDRCYPDFKEMAVKESVREDGIEAVVIVTPNNLHIPIAKEFLKRGIHVICDKPLAANNNEIRSFSSLVKKSDIIFAITYNYSGYPMIRLAREMVINGEIGNIRSIQVEYAQDWLQEKLEDTGHKQAVWRMDPFQAGDGGCLSDIGTHAFHLVCFVTGLQPSLILADLNHFVDGRSLADNANILFRFASGASGMLWISQVASGNKNGLRLRIFGSKAGIEWSQEEPNYLKFSSFGKPSSFLGKEDLNISPSAKKSARTPPGHPEGFIEAFANIYNEIAEAIICNREGKSVPGEVLYPNFIDGVAGMKFINTAIKSNANNSKWMPLSI